MVVVMCRMRWELDVGGWRMSKWTYACQTFELELLQANVDPPSRLPADNVHLVKAPQTSNDVQSASLAGASRYPT